MTDAPQQSGRPPTRAQFDLSAALMLLLVASVMAGAGFYLVQSLLQTDKSQRIVTQFVFILMTLAGPMVLMLVVSLARSLFEWISRSR